MSIAERIKAFEEVRDIPYRFDFRDRSKDTTCLSKSKMLKERLEEFRLQARHMCCSYRWDQTMLPQELAARAPYIDGQHHFLEVLVPETRRWVKVDAMWDSALKDAGFRVAEWDGLHSTILAISKPIHFFSPEQSEAIRLTKDNVDPRFWHLLDVSFGSFYEELNQWIESKRTPLTGKISPSPGGKHNA